ncbi:MAG: molybdopterin-dependent oxidoreductase, partial [Halanaeroarchaeum sp.]
MSVRDVTDLYEEFGDDRVPPGQRITEEFPIFSLSGTPSFDEASWRFEVSGAVDEELSLTWDEFTDLPSETQRQDFHCVTGWSKLDCRFTGVPFPEIARRAGVREDAEHVVFHALDGYTTDLPLADASREEVLFTWSFDGEPLEADHGGPLRVVTPHK